MDQVSLIVVTRSFKEGFSAIEGLRGWDEVIIQQGDPVQPAILRNLAAAKASGDILIFMDDDVRLYPRDLTWFAHRPAGEEWWAPVLWKDATGDRNTRLSTLLFTMLQTNVPRLLSVGGFIAVRKALFRAVGGFDPHQVAEDMQFGGKLKERGSVMRLAPFRATFTRPVPTLGKTLQRYPAWRKFPEPKETPHIIMRRTPCGARGL